MSHLHLREAMALPSRIAQYLKRHQSNQQMKRKPGNMFKKKRQDAVDQTVQSTDPNPRKRTSDEFGHLSSDASSDRFIDADAPPPQKRPRWPAAEDCDGSTSLPEKQSRSPTEEIANVTAHEDTVSSDCEELVSPAKRIRSLAEDIADATCYEDGEPFDDEAPFTAHSRSLAEELADALASESESSDDFDDDELADATANEDGNPFDDQEPTVPNLLTLLADEFVGTTVADAGDASYLEAIIDLSHFSFTHCNPTSFRPLRSLAEELAQAIANEDIEPFDDPDELFSRLPELTDNDDDVSILIVSCGGSQSLKGNAFVSSLQGRCLAEEILDATSDEYISETGNDASFVTALETLSDDESFTEDEEAPICGRRRSLADEIADATSGEEGDPFDVDEDLPADMMMASESSAGVPNRPLSLWRKYLSTPVLLGSCPMQ
ncbi:hypothetical protein QBC32DRAFT_385682 [Pseudoneurospora amorphoporcata]|uniref:Uncharacterized protein n=1 Tax=Pseudoneurospora amorphoporcata TaxID=241081 RepID=A0AAN6P013_9PEZI|nr:hypothetical protein QBC32DRAFT_385682 [Pseudoneurospora amorphoporcata]